jgi:hypothetical protein
MLIEPRPPKTGFGRFSPHPIERPQKKPSTKMVFYKLFHLNSDLGAGNDHKTEFTEFLNIRIGDFQVYKLAVSAHLCITVRVKAQLPIAKVIK